MCLEGAAAVAAAWVALGTDAPSSSSLLPSVPENQSNRKYVSIDHTRHCIHTYNKKIKIHVRINSTVKVIRACTFIVLSVLEVT